MYLPDGELTAVQQSSFVDLIHSILNYPGDVSEEEKDAEHQR